LNLRLAYRAPFLQASRDDTRILVFERHGVIEVEKQHSIFGALSQTFLVRT
jgi:hypothetical protein